MPESRVRPRFLGRPFQPLILGLVLTMVIVAQANFRLVDRGTVFPLSVFVGVMATCSALMLGTGWVFRWRRVMEYGLLLVVAAYLTRATFIYLASSFDTAVWFSLTTAFMASGAYFLEANARRTGRE